MIRVLRRRLGLAGAAAALAAVSLLGGSSYAGSSGNTAAAPAAAAACTALAATNTAQQTKVVFTSDPTLYGSLAWTNMACGATAVTAPRGLKVLTVVQVDAEVTCTGPDGEWCLGRVLIGNAEGGPNAPELTGSFAWSNSEPNAAQWESNAFTRSRELACPANFPLPVCTWPVTVQVRVHAAGLSFRVDDSTVHLTGTYHH